MGSYAATHRLLPAADYPTAHCLLPSAFRSGIISKRHSSSECEVCPHCVLPTADCLLPTAYCLPLTAYCSLLTAFCAESSVSRFNFVTEKVQ